VNDHGADPVPLEGDAGITNFRYSALMSG